ncbi:type 2 lanthipeptide synthetase LanM [Pedobacter xixiisoli]|nr:type 2 lanthipeptide synthetase LanM [Pedobacter xixiisoli]
MKQESIKSEILKISRELKPEEINNFIKSTDLYFTLFPLNKYIARRIRKLVSQFDIEDRFAKPAEIIFDLNFQLNIQLRNTLFQYLLVHELRIANIAGLLEGADDQSKRKSFNKLSADEEWIEYIFEKYKYLEHRLEVNVSNLLQHLENILCRIDTDWKEIQYFIDQENEKITKIDLFLGDAHQHGQSVSKISFKSRSILYKPRNQNLEECLISLLDFIKHQGEDITIKIPNFINRDHYAWVEHVSNTEVATLEEINDFYTIHGQALALFYILGTVDIIGDNVIAVGKHPTIIDLECLLSRHAPIDRSSAFTNYFEESVTSTGVLPTLNIGDNLERDYFGGALHARGSEKIKTNVWNSLEGMDITVSAKEVFRVAADDEKHLPVFKGKKYGITEEYLEYLLKGFSKTINFIYLHKQEITEYILNSGLFSRVPFRILTHPTAVYDKLSRSFLIPEAFKSLAKEREVKSMLKRTFSFNTKAINSAIVTSISAQFKEGDIPYFYTYHDSKHLYTSGNQVAVKNHFIKSKDSIEGILDRLKYLDKQTIDSQLRIIEGTCNFYFHIKFGKYDISDQTRYINFPKQDLPKTDLLSGVKIIADHYMSKMFKIEEEINWLGKTTNQKDQRYEFTPLSYDMYDGTLGISFFLLYASKYIKESGYFEVAEKIFLSSKKVFREQYLNGFFKQLTSNEKKGLPVSPLYYPSSILYMMEHFSAFDKKYVDQEFIDLYIQFINSVLEENQNWDILMGQAGLLELLINLNDDPNFPNFDELIIKIVNRIVSNGTSFPNQSVAWSYTNMVTNEIDKYFGGYAHGTAGIALVLAKAQAVLKKEKIEESIAGALNYDRQLFDENKKRWKDMREPERNWDSISWCHGSTGIALSRVYLSEYRADPMLVDEVKYAVNNILNGKTESDCLCHGRGSDYEVLSLCASYLRDKKLQEKVTSKLHALNKNILSNSYQMVYGDGNKMEMLGLFTGLCGIGYVLLRHYDWENVPSVISNESSNLNYRTAHQI